MCALCQGRLLTALVDLTDLLKEFDRASDESGIWEGVSSFFSSKDIKAYIYHNFPGIGATRYEQFQAYQNNLTEPPDPSCRVENSEFEILLRDNVRTLTAPRFWSDWNLLKSAAQNLNECHPVESIEGISIPVHGPRGRNGCFSLEFSDASAGPEGLDMQLIQWVCQYAHQSFCRLQIDQPSDLPRLTEREKQILTWMALGKSNADIADILDISFHTVGTYTRRIFVKTNTNNRTSAALYGISNGLINV